MNDFFIVAVMTPVLHYTMGGLEIDAESRVLSTTQQPIPGLFAAGEVAGGVHSANRLGGSSLLNYIIFKHINGDSAAAYLLDDEQGCWQGGRASRRRRNACRALILRTRPKEGAPAPATSSSSSGAKEFTMEEVAKHNKKDDIWVVVSGQVLDVTSFLPDHPGGEKAIILYAGRDATEEFNMLHDPKVIPRHVPEAAIGNLKK